MRVRCCRRIMCGSILGGAIAMLFLGCTFTNKDNTLRSVPTSLDRVGAPHEFFVTLRDGEPVRVYLDTAEVEKSPPAHRRAGPSPIASFEAGDLVVAGGSFPGRFAGIHGEEAKVSMSGDFASVLTERVAGASWRELIVIDLEERTQRRYRLPEDTRSHSWTGSADIKVVGERTSSLLYLHSGELRPDDVSDAELREARQRDLTTTRTTRCWQYGGELERTREGTGQRIIWTAVASSTFPERIAQVKPRVLVKATDHWQSPHRRGPRGGTRDLKIEFVTERCTHFVFSFGSAKYVASIATGAFARLDF